jgi:HSP20 family protein
VFQDFDRLFDEGDRLFGSMGWPSSLARRQRGFRGLTDNGGDYPRVNVRDEGDHYSVDALAPGLDDKTLSVSVNDRTLTFSGERNGSSDIPADKFLISERTTGRFTRSYTLPGRIDQSGIQAEYKDGHLRVTLPKAEDSKPKAIEVSVSN